MTEAACVELVWDVESDQAVQGFWLIREDMSDMKTIRLPMENLLSAARRSYIDEHTLPGHNYRYTLVTLLLDGHKIYSPTARVTISPISMELYQNHPNPFNPTTTIAFTLPRREKVDLSVYNIEGKLVTNLLNEPLDEGSRQVTWNGTDSHGNPVSSGVYFYRLKAGGKTLTKKMVLLK